jgi:hypothetical protein
MIKHRTACLGLVTLVIIFCLFMIGCEKKTDRTASSSAKNKPLPERVLDLETEVLLLKKQMLQRSSGFVTVTTEDKGYSIVQTRYGSFAVKCEDVSQYMDGYKVHLAIGNLTCVTFNGAKIAVSWGKSPVSKREISVTNSFLPGSYTSIEFVMTPATPEDIKSFDLLFEFDEMALYKEGQ